MKRFFVPLMLLSLLVLAACSDTTPEVTPTPEAAGFRFNVDVDSGQVRITALPSNKNWQAQQTDGPRELRAGREISAEVVRSRFGPNNTLTLEATFTNVTAEKTFLQPFSFRPALTPEEGNYVSSAEPNVTDADLGGDGILSPGETTSALTFTVKHKGESFSYFVEAYAVEAGGCGDGTRTTLRTQADIDALAGCRVLNGSLYILTDAATLDFSPLDSLRTITKSFYFSSAGGFEEGNDFLTAISGFNGLESIGWGFNIFGSSSGNLTTISGFEKLRSIGTGLDIAANPVLTSIPEFGALESVGTYVSVFNNASLETVSGFGKLRNVAVTGDPAVEDALFEGFNSFSISRNPSLSSISGFESLDEVGGVDPLENDFSISNNATLTSISGFDSLTSDDVFGSVVVNDNNAFNCSVPPQSNLPFLPVDESVGNLVDCPTRGGDAVEIDGDVTIRSQADVDALEGVVSIGGDLVISVETATLDLSPLDGLQTVGRNLSITGNPSLTAVSGFGALEDVTLSLVIADNPALTAIPEFGKLETVGFDLDISDNPSLTAVSGFGALRVTGRFINFNVNPRPRFVISNNDALTAVSGFGALEEVLTSFSIIGNASLTTVAGFADFGAQDGTFISDNPSFDCSVPPQSELPFLPLGANTDESEGNLVDCPVIGGL